ncbi:hypothetical protein LEN26_009051 [Aphanomyces euteiches]|nr:hypothetical protein AeMF1_012548 [Aphanomyces euteiches]KAH9128893.1 hypothetical protein LEN26_009051 [Aphanomyces euteiches]KAH9189207.1 hypothetical protein AeNC1_008811 [Aphanomyces euteiches]
MTPFRPTKNMEDYIATATVFNNLSRAIDCLAYLPLSAADFFRGIGHAAACGKVEIAQYLAAQFERAHSNSTTPPSGIQRNQLKEDLEGISFILKLHHVEESVKVWDPDNPSSQVI